MRRLLSAIIFGLVLMITASAAFATEGDYPPQPAGSGIGQRAPTPGPAVDSASAVESQLAGEGGLAGTGSDVAELGIGAGLILLGGTALLLAARRRGDTARGRG